MHLMSHAGLTMIRLPTLIQAVLLAVVAVASGVQARVLHAQSDDTTSDIQQHLHMHSYALGDSVSHSFEAEDGLGGARRDLQNRRRRRRRFRPQATAVSAGVAAASGEDAFTLTKALAATSTTEDSASAFSGSLAIAKSS